MSKNDDELNEFNDEVTDGGYNLPCVKVIFKLVKQMQSWGDERIKKIVAALDVEGIKISITTELIYGIRIRMYAYFLQYTFYDTFQQYTLVKSVRSKSYTFSCLTGWKTVFLSLESPVMRS